MNAKTVKCRDCVPSIVMRLVLVLLRSVIPVLVLLPSGVVAVEVR